MGEHVGYPVLAQLDLVAQQHMQVLKSMNMYSLHSPHESSLAEHFSIKLTAARHTQWPCH